MDHGRHGEQGEPGAGDQRCPDDAGGREAHPVAPEVGGERGSGATDADGEGGDAGEDGERRGGGHDEEDEVEGADPAGGELPRRLRGRTGGGVGGHAAPPADGTGAGGTSTG
ncbi:hypothetical protein GCM10010299_19430 [Streptomyces tanashiensis]|nr:hypothetical protein GCM10010299_19430 [Streptomyces tanashiensis]